MLSLLWSLFEVLVVHVLAVLVEVEVEVVVVVDELAACPQQ